MLSLGDSSVQADVIRQTPGSDYLSFEAEAFDELEGDELSGFYEVDVTSDEETAFGSILLPPDSNVSGAALYDQVGGGNFVDIARYQLEFAEPGDYNVYLRYSLYEAQDETNYGNEDSFYLLIAILIPLRRL